MSDIFQFASFTQKEFDVVTCFAFWNKGSKMAFLCLKFSELGRLICVVVPGPEAAQCRLFANTALGSVIGWTHTRLRPATWAEPLSRVPGPKVCRALWLREAACNRRHWKTSRYCRASHSPRECNPGVYAIVGVFAAATQCLTIVELRS